MITCEKEITINVTGGRLAAYWSFDEVAGDYSDQVSGKIIFRSGLTNLAGKNNNSTKDGPGDSWLLSPIQPAGGAPGVTFNAATSTGFTMFFWNFYSQPNPLFADGFAILAFDLYQGGVFKFNGATFVNQPFAGPPPHLSYSAPQGTGTVNFVLPNTVFQTWFFVACSWDRTNQLMKLYFNGVPVASSPTVADTITPGAYDLIAQFEGGGSFFSPLSFVGFDEMGIVPDQALSDAQILAIFNSGNGVFWPAIKTIVPV